MGLILKIAAGIIIGLLLVQIINFNRIDENYKETGNNLRQAQDLKNKHIILTNAIHFYYKKHRALPEFISDLKCIDMFKTRQPIPCASVVSNGVFYVNHGMDWASAEPYIMDKKVFNKCRTSRSFASIDPGFRGCLALDVKSVPKKKTPEFDCSNTSDKAERIICSSDRLIDSDVKLSSIYKNMLASSPEDIKQKIIEDKIYFNKQRSKKCNTSECIKTMTSSKITRLELMGIRESH